MKIQAKLRLAVTASALCIGGCGAQFTHVTPGNSARTEIAVRNAPSAKPVPTAMPNASGLPPQPGQISSANRLPDPDTGIAPAPDLPTLSDQTTRAADAFTRGSFAMESGQLTEAIVAFEEAVAADPNFADAWSKLVLLYQKNGDEAKSIAAYKKAKQLGQLRPNADRGSGGILPQ